MNSMHVFVNYSKIQQQQTTDHSEKIGSGLKGRHGSENKGNFESGQSKSKVCSYILKHRNKATLTVVRARVKWVLIYSNIENNGNFESGQSKSKVCSYILKHRE